MPSLNKVVLIGRLTRDPELRYTSSGVAMANFSIAVDRRFKNQQGERQTDFFRCTAWRQTAEFVNNYLQKGRLIAVTGSVEINEYTAQDGARRTSVDVSCETVEVLEWPKDGSGPRPAGEQPSGQYFNDEVGAGPAQPRQQPAQSGPPQAPQRPAQPAAPSNDFDDSDPFADE